MTLMRQLAAVLIVLFILLFAGTMAITVKDTRSYLDAQLQTISQDTATALGLSLSPVLAAKETVVAESMVDAIFDSGYYGQVAILDVSGKLVLDRQAPRKVEGVPDWFVRALPLQTPKGEALIMSGWQQQGKVVVAAHPGQAYLTLWQHGVKAFWWFLAMLLASAVLGMCALHFLLRPLRKVETQAAAICDREYQIQESLPRTLELRRVVEAMNRMSGKVRDMHEEQSTTIERMRAESHRDTVTGLANRRYFDMRLAQMVEDSDAQAPSAMLIIELNDIKGLNQRRGYQSGNQALQRAAALIEQACRQSPASECFVARIGGDSFAVVLTGTAEDEAHELGRGISAALSSLHQEGLMESAVVSHIGIASYAGGTLAQLLSNADMALRAAQENGANEVVLRSAHGAQDAPVLSATAWAELLRQALAARNFDLYVQPVLQAGDRASILHQEIHVRLRGVPEHLAMAGTFLPMARRAGLAQAIDQRVISEVIERVRAGLFPEARLALNLSASAVNSPAFVEWLVLTLEQAPQLAPRLAFEISEYAARQSLDSLLALVRRLRAQGAQFGIDHYGHGLVAHEQLAALKLDYLKIDGGLVRAIDASRDNRIMVESIITMAHGLDLQAIAERVEDQAAWQALAGLNLDGVVGHGVARPFLAARTEAQGSGIS